MLKTCIHALPSNQAIILEGIVSHSLPKLLKSFLSRTPNPSHYFISRFSNLKYFNFQISQKASRRVLSHLRNLSFISIRSEFTRSQSSNFENHYLSSEFQRNLSILSHLQQIHLSGQFDPQLYSILTAIEKSLSHLSNLKSIQFQNIQDFPLPNATLTQLTLLKYVSQLSIKSSPGSNILSCLTTTPEMFSNLAALSVSIENPESQTLTQVGHFNQFKKLTQFQFGAYGPKHAEYQVARKFLKNITFPSILTSLDLSLEFIDFSFINVNRSVPLDLLLPFQSFYHNFAGLTLLKDLTLRFEIS